MKIQKILYPTDFSKTSARALDQAIVLAHRFNATLVMLHVETPYSSDPHNPKKEFPDLNTLFEFIRDQSEKRMDEGGAPVLSGKITIQEVVRRGISPSEAILSYAKEEEIDLIVMGTHSRSEIGHFLLGSTTEKVVHGTDISVLAIGHGEDLFIRNEGVYRRILIPIDFSDASHKAFRLGIDIANQFEAHIDIVHVVEPVLTHQALFSGETSQIVLDKDMMSRSKDAIHEFAGEMLPKNHEIHLRSGQVHKEIIKLIREVNTDLVVLGNHGWNAVERFLLGGTSEKLIRKSPIPVLIAQ